MPDRDSARYRRGIPGSVEALDRTHADALVNGRTSMLSKPVDLGTRTWSLPLQQLGRSLLDGPVAGLPEECWFSSINCAGDPQVPGGYNLAG